MYWIHLTFVCLFMFIGSVSLAFGLTLSKCVIKSPDNNSPKAFFDVESPQMRNEKRKGLMFRKKLDSNHGMIFVFTPPEIVSFWMKNTEIPLDILFADEDNIIVSIYENRQPFDLRVFGPPSKIHAVLEISAGSVQKYNLKVGDLLDYDNFKQTTL